jgi:hypothetical protein
VTPTLEELREGKLIRVFQSGLFIYYSRAQHGIVLLKCPAKPDSILEKCPSEPCLECPMFSNHVYPQIVKLETPHSDVFGIIAEEERRFNELLRRVEPKFIKAVSRKGFLDAETAFLFHTTYGFPFDCQKDYCQAEGIPYDEEGFRTKMKQHAQISRSKNCGAATT